MACPFGVPELYEDRQIMMKCDMCYDRSSVGRKPMCATVCPSQALFFGTLEQIEQLRPSSAPTNVFQFGHQTITTRVFTMVPRQLAARTAHVDVTAAMAERPPSRVIRLRLASAHEAVPPPDADPFGEVETP
jgi:Fe-S-cluster-containing dehydrogenase component